MAKLKKELIMHSEGDRDTMMKIVIEVNVNADGMFTTTLSKEDAAMFESYGIKLKNNRAQRPGFFMSDTMAGLCSNICDIMRQCLEYKVVSETPVLKYYIKTYCSYCLNNQTGDIAPNGKSQYVGDGGYRWIEGTSKETFFSDKDFGIKVYVRPYMKRVVEYGNGKQKIFYDYKQEWGEGTYMEWLNNLSGMRSASNIESLQEIEGTEENARFFVNIVKQICRINEQIGEIIKNDKLEQLIQSTLKLEDHINLYERTTD